MAQAARSQKSRAGVPSASDTSSASAQAVGGRELKDGERRHARRGEGVSRLRDHSTPIDGRSAVLTTVFSLSVLAGIAYAYVAVGDYELTPKDGLGYYLGIVGGLMMLGLMLYPARKHYKFMQAWGSVPGWFNAHMILGIVGPALVVAHSGFELNSKNATVAMIAMLLVVGSGIVGRYIYAGLHLGLYGRRAEANDLIKEIQQVEATLAIGSSIPIEALGQLRELADATLASTKTMKGSFSFLTRTTSRRKLKRAMHTELEASVAAAALNSLATPAMLRSELDKAHATLDGFFYLVEKMGSLRFYERLFHTWHVLHLPLFFLLIVTGFVHVLAVHLY